MSDAASEVYGLGERAMARKSDPETSHDAAASISEEALTRSQHCVLAALRGGAASDGWIERIASGWAPSRLRTARCELVRKGLVRDSGQRERTPSNRWSVVWELVPR